MSDNNINGSQHLDIIKAVVNLISSEFPENGNLSDEQTAIYNNISILVGQVNKIYFSSEVINFNALNEYLLNSYSNIQKAELLKLLTEWINFITDTHARRDIHTNFIDSAFYEYIDRARYVEYEVLKEQVINALYQLDPREIAHIEYFYEHFSGFWGMLNIKNDNYEVIESRMRSITEHWQDFVWFYESLSDYRSKYVLLKDIEYWFTYKRDNTVLKMREYAFYDYFDLDILSCDGDEVIVDLGAYIGDTIRDYVTCYGDYKRVFCFEVSPWNVEGIKQTLAGYHDINIIQKAAGDSCGTTSMYISPVIDSCNSKNIEVGYNLDVDVVTVDAEVTEPVTLIKMDIEGAEQSALLGCREHILNDHPKLLICVYHNNEDIWKIPRMICDIRSDYDFYLRSNGDQWGPSEIVLFALPK